MPRFDRVLVDSATFYPISMADLALRLAVLGLFEILWSDDLLNEVERVLVEKKGLSAQSSRYFCDCIRGAFPVGRIPRERHLPLVATRTGPDPDDHVHGAAVVACGATVILSAAETTETRTVVGYAAHSPPAARSSL